MTARELSVLTSTRSSDLRSQISKYPDEESLLRAGAGMRALPELENLVFDLCSLESRIEVGGSAKEDPWLNTGRYPNSPYSESSQAF